MSEGVPRMTKDELKAMLDNPDLVIIDVRAGTDWLRSDMKIKGAVREDYNDVKSWARKYSKDRLIILYCA
jgi:rhodanese-related sulfurtransferase